ncbi:MAG: surface-adhesin E family protein [Gallionella sp.]
MGKFILMSLLAIVSSNVMADWMKITSIHSQDSPETQTAYTDTATMHKSGNFVSMWVLVDHQSGLSQGVENKLDKIFSRTKNDITKSWKVEDEFDCLNVKLRMLSYTAYSEHMGNGEIIPSNMAINHWVPVIPGSIGQALWLFVCRKNS